MLFKKTDCCWWEGLEKRKFLSLIKLLKTEHRVNAVILPLVHLGEATEHKVHKAGQWIFLKLPAVLETIKDRGFGWLFLFYKLKLNWKSMVKVLSSNYWFCNWPSLHIGSNRNLSGFFFSRQNKQTLQTLAESWVKLSPSFLRSEQPHLPLAFLLLLQQVSSTNRCKR